MFVAVDGKPAGLIGVADPIKASTPEAIRALHGEGVRVVMLTGDNRDHGRGGRAGPSGSTKSMPKSCRSRRRRS